MQNQSIIQFASSLLPMLHGENDWCAWFFFQNEQVYIDTQTKRFQSLEETVLMKNWSNQLSNRMNDLNPNHFCFQFTSFNNPKSYQLYTIENQSFHAIIIGSPIAESAFLHLEKLLNEEASKNALKFQSFKMIQRLQEQQTQLKQQIDQLIAQQKETLKAQIDIWISKQFIPVNVSPDAVNLLLESSIHFSLFSVLDHALTLAQYTQIQTDTAITIHPEHIDIQETSNPKNTSTRLNSRAEILLDKYEACAQGIHQKKEIIIGRTLAENLIPAVSPPAITDAIKKNRKAISQAMHQYPDRWPLIRNYLKPLKELDFQLNLKPL